VQLVSVHSHKGGAGKTALVLMMARHLAEHGKKVCLVDLDFLGTGVWPTIKASLPHRYLGEVFVAAAGSRSYPPLEDLLGFHRIGAKVEPIGLILNAGSAAGIGKNGKRAELHEQVVSLMGIEPQTTIIESSLKNLLPRLRESGFDYVFMDCHPTLEEISETVLRVQMAQRESESSVVLVATADRVHIYGLLKEIHRRTKSKTRKTLRTDRTVFVVNRVEKEKTERPYETRLDTFAQLASELKKDPLIGDEAPSLLRGLQLPHYCRLLWNRTLSSAAFAVRSTGEIPRFPSGVLAHSGTALCTELFGPAEG